MLSNYRSVVENKIVEETTPEKKLQSSNNVSSVRRYLEIYESIMLGQKNDLKQAFNEPIASPASCMLRREDAILQENKYIQWFDSEARRNRMHVLTTAGTLDIIVVQALHLPVSNRPVFCR